MFTNVHDCPCLCQIKPTYTLEPHLFKLQYNLSSNLCLCLTKSSFPSCKGKGLPQQAEVAQGVPGRLKPQIFLTFSTMRVVGHQPYAQATFTPGEIPGTHF